MIKKNIFTALLFFFCFCLLSTSVHAQNNNWLNNPYADADTNDWIPGGDAAVEVINGNPAFVVRNGGHFTQEIQLSEDMSGKFMLIIGLARSERSNVNGNITGVPYFYAYEVEAIQTDNYDELYINNYLKVNDMLHTAKDIYQWVVVWEIFQISESTNTIELFLMQAERMGVPQNGSAARFDDLGVYFFNSADEAEAFVSAY